MVKMPTAPAIVIPSHSFCKFALNIGLQILQSVSQQCKCSIVFARAFQSQIDRRVNRRVQPKTTILPVSVPHIISMRFLVVFTPLTHINPVSFANQLPICLLPFCSIDTTFGAFPYFFSLFYPAVITYTKFTPSSVFILRVSLFVKVIKRFFFFAFITFFHINILTQTF